MFCNNCGKQLPDGAQFCTGCGTRLAPPVVPAAPGQEIPLASAAPVEPAAPVYEAPTVPVQEAPAPAPKKKKGKGLKIALLILIPLLLIGGGVGAWLGITASNEKKANEAAYEAAEKLLEEGKYDEAQKAFEELGDFSDSADRAEELAKQAADYAAAGQLVKDGKYDEAIKAYEALKDYLDSKEMAEHGVSYQKGLDLIAKADEINAYYDAIAIFEQMLDYKDSADQISHAYLGMALMAIEAEDFDAALRYMESMNEEDAQTAYDAYMGITVDAKALLALEEALIARQNQIDEWIAENEPTDYGLVCELELELLAEFEDGVYADDNIQALIRSYLDGLYTQLECLHYYDDGTSYPADMIEWYVGAAERMDVLHELINEYDFLADNKELKDIYEDAYKLEWALVDIEELVQSQLWGIAPYEEDGEYYLELYNYTQYDFSLECVQRYGYEGEFVGDENWFTVEVVSGETVRVYLQFPADLDFTEWYIDWTIYDVYDGQEALN